MENQTKKKRKEVKRYFLRIWCLNKQANKMFPLISAQFNGFLICYFPATSKKLGSAVVALSFWISQRVKASFLERTFISMLTQLTLISEPFFFLSVCMISFSEEQVCYCIFGEEVLPQLCCVKTVQLKAHTTYEHLQGSLWTSWSL